MAGNMRKLCSPGTSCTKHSEHGQIEVGWPQWAGSWFQTCFCPQIQLGQGHTAPRHSGVKPGGSQENLQPLPVPKRAPKELERDFGHRSGVIGAGRMASH